jgi:hypothetical protein
VLAASKGVLAVDDDEREPFDRLMILRLPVDDTASLLRPADEWGPRSGGPLRAWHVSWASPVPLPSFRPVYISRLAHLAFSN